MSRKLPLCVECGKPLAGAKARIVNEFNGVKGRPMFGHCWNPDGDDCAAKAPKLHGFGKAKLSDALRAFSAKGANRIALTKGVTLEQACADADRIDAGRRP
jgi:hypothetical protein